MERFSIWRSVCWHPLHEAMCVIYVDDLKAVAPSNVMDRIWKELQSVVDREDPTLPDSFLGCYATPCKVWAKVMRPVLDFAP